MPSLQEFGVVLNNNAFNLVEFARSKPIISGQQERIEPELGLITGSFDMDMRRFLTFVTKEIESESADA